MSLNVELLKTTFQRAKTGNGGATRLGMRFYERLFEKYPQVRPLFKTPPEEQHKKLLASVAAIVGTVTQPEIMVPYLHAMGIRHLKYGTENGHYAAVGENLVAVLGEHLSAEGEWTPEMADTWKTALTAVSDIMIEAANEPKKFESEMLASGYLSDGFKAAQQPAWLLAIQPVA